MAYRDTFYYSEIWSFYGFKGHKYLVVIKIKAHNENQGKISNF